MKFKTVLWFCLLSLALAATAFAVSTNTESPTYTVPGSDLRIITIDWHDNDALSTGTDQTVQINGYVHQVVTYPHINGTAHVAPQSGYDVYFYHHNDSLGHPFGSTLLEDRSVTATEYAYPTVSPYVDWGTMSHKNSTVLNGGGVVQFFVSPLPR